MRHLFLPLRWHNRAFGPDQVFIRTGKLLQTEKYGVQFSPHFLNKFPEILAIIVNVPNPNPNSNQAPANGDASSSDYANGINALNKFS